MGFADAFQDMQPAITNENQEISDISHYAPPPPNRNGQHISIASQLLDDNTHLFTNLDMGQ